MAKNKLNLNVGDIEPAQTPKAPPPAKKKRNKQASKTAAPSLWARIVKKFRETISELKKVDWPPFKRTKNNPGVLANTTTVLIVVLFFMIVVTAVDTGLGALLRLLTSQA
ncbi:MAG: preprotein translocase subunit SecE [Clostridia bacterium]